MFLQKAGILLKPSLSLNRRLYTANYVAHFFFVPIAIWPLVYSQYITFTQLGLIYSAAFIWQTILELPSGALADMIGRKKTVVMGFVFRFFGFVSIILSSSFIWFLVAELLDKTFEALYSGSNQALIFDSLKEQGLEAEF